MGGFFGSIPSVAISDSTVAGRTLLTSATTQGLRTAIDTFVSAVSFGAFPVSGNFQRIYLALDTAKTYVWNGTGYSEASPNEHARTGTNNTNVGETALASASLSGSNNSAVGANALNLNTSGGNNTAVGTDALLSNTTGAENTANGAYALTRNTTGDGNLAIGYGALFSNTTGDYNTALGAGLSLWQNTTGANNTAIGAGAGTLLVSGDGNTLVGSGSNVDSSGRSLCIALGTQTFSPAVDGSLAIGGAGAWAMGNLVTTSGGTSASQDLIIYLNGTRYLIALKT
jgi:hypothetical protein